MWAGPQQLSNSRGPHQKLVQNRSLWGRLPWSRSVRPPAYCSVGRTLIFSPILAESWRRLIGAYLYLNSERCGRESQRTPHRSIRRQTKSTRTALPSGRVFLLSVQKNLHLDLSAKERSLLRPYHDLKDIGRYRLTTASLWLIYSTRYTCPDITDYPKLQRHLSRFKPIMEQRRETLGEEQFVVASSLAA